ncbi:MAG: hypothetical protein WC728_13115 [Elusimicrobiota bacterium]
MKISTILALFLLLPASGARGQNVGVNAPPIINLGLMDALAKIDEPALAAVFAFVPEDRVSLAMAYYLVQDQDVLKRFVGKVRRDFKDTGGVCEWDREVLLHLVMMGASMQPPPGFKPIPKGLMKKINELSLMQPLPLQEIVQRRAQKGR